MVQHLRSAQISDRLPSDLPSGCLLPALSHHLTTKSCDKISPALPTERIYRTSLPMRLPSAAPPPKTQLSSRPHGLDDQWPHLHTHMHKFQVRITWEREQEATQVGTCMSPLGMRGICHCTFDFHTASLSLDQHSK